MFFGHLDLMWEFSAVIPFDDYILLQHGCTHVRYWSHGQNFHFQNLGIPMNAVIFWPILLGTCISQFSEHIEEVACLHARLAPSSALEPCTLVSWELGKLEKLWDMTVGQDCNLLVQYRGIICCLDLYCQNYMYKFVTCIIMRH